MSAPSFRSFPENLKAWRKTKKLTQEAAAKELGVTIGALRTWEQEIRSPTLTDEINQIYQRILADLAEHKKADTTPEKPAEEGNVYTPGEE